MKAFETYLISECGYSNLTARDYLGILARIGRWLQAAKVQGVAAARPDEIRAYLRALSTRGQAATTLIKNASAVVTYWRFLGRPQEDIDAIERPRTPTQLPALPNRQEITMLIEAASDLRDRAILELLYATGIRADELCQLCIGDLTAEFLTIRQGKGGKDRVVPCGQLARGALAAYLFTRGNVLPADPMFLIQSGDRRLSYAALLAVVEKYAKLTKQRVAITPHTFRHCFATHLLMGKANLREIQTMMGHESLEATARYLRLDDTYLKSIHTRCHPSERRSRGLPPEVPIRERAA